MTSNFSGFVVKRLNASSEVPKTWTVTLQPVLSSNGFTQFTSGEVEPFSAYPGHASTVRAPSPCPTEVGRLGVGDGLGAADALADGAPLAPAEAEGAAEG